MKTAFLGAVLLALPAAAHAAKPKIAPTVEFARSWEAAVAEARLLNVPIVVHAHGFYCPSCWNMHQSVLRNKAYMQHAAERTVEVITVSRLDEGIEKGEGKAARYTAREGNESVERLVEWPNLTRAELEALGRSPAARFNDTGLVPFTCIVDPHTEKEMARLTGLKSAGALIEAAEAARRELVEEHGSGMSRKELRRVEAVLAEAAELRAAGEFGKALAVIEKGVPKELPEVLAARVAAEEEEVRGAAGAALQAVEGRFGEDPVAARRELAALVRRLGGTGMEGRARELLDGK